MSPTIIDNRRIYSLPMLVTTWVFSILAELAVIGIAGLEVYSTSFATRYDSEFCDGSYGYYEGLCSTGPNATLISLAVALAFASVSLIARIVQITLYSQQKLSPTVNFGFDLSRFVIWTVIFIWTIVAYGLYITNLTITVITVPVAWVFYLIAIVYSSVIYHRYRKGEYNSPITSYGQQQYWPGHPNQAFPGAQQPYFFPGQAQLIPGQPCPTCGTVPAASAPQRQEIQEHYQPEKRESTPHIQPTTV